MKVTYSTEDFDYNGSGIQRQRVKMVMVEDAPGQRTTRLIGHAAPKPLSQYTNKILGLREVHTVRGHLIGLRFGGPEDPRNIVPMYADFNGGSGAWGKFETQLAALFKTKGLRVHIGVTCKYADVTSAVPSAIFVQVEKAKGGDLPMNFEKQRLVQQALPIARRVSLTLFDLARKKIIDEINKEMVSAKWCFEDLNIMQGVVTRTTDNRKRLRVGTYKNNDVKSLLLRGVDPVKYRQLRPYAMLDYMKVVRPDIYQTAGFPHFLSYSGAEDFGNMVPAIQKVNELHNFGFMKSDLWNLTAQEEHEYLIMASAEQQAQADHICELSKGGARAYSNARLISSYLNKRLNNTGVREQVQVELDNYYSGLFSP